MNEELKKAIELLVERANAHVNWPCGSIEQWFKTLDENAAALALIEKSLTPSEEQESALKIYDDFTQTYITFSKEKYRGVPQLDEIIKKKEAKIASVRSYIASPRADKTLETKSALNKIVTEINATKTLSAVLRGERYYAYGITEQNVKDLNDIISESEASK